MNRYEVRLECLKIALREPFKDPEALRDKVDLYYAIASNGEELPAASPTVQVFNGTDGRMVDPPPMDPKKGPGNPVKDAPKGK